MTRSDTGRGGSLAPDSERLQAVAGVLDFVVPFDVLSAVGLVFALENIVEAYITTGTIPAEWAAIYVAFAVVVGVVRYLSADDEEVAGFEEDLDELA